MSFLKLPVCAIILLSMKNVPAIITQVEYVPVAISVGLLPSLIERAGSDSCNRFLEFFAARIRNRGTRDAYARAAGRFFAWCDQYQIELAQISPFAVASYIEQLMQELSPSTVKLHLAAIRSLFDYLVTGQVVPVNPAASVRGPKHVVKKGKTPVLTAEEARLLLDGIDLRTITGVRDRALIGVLVYSFARVSAAVGMNVGDYFSQGRRMWFRLHEKGGKHHEVPVHHNAEEYVDAYLQRAGICDEAQGPLFRTVDSWSNLTTCRMHRVDVLRMIKRRARQVGLSSRVCCHTFRATGITAYLQGGGLLEHAQRIAAHESVRSTKLYDRTSDTISLDEIEKIQI
ncbi:tyrosine-type recombinase/integrase [Bythopirellula goksoeyrii]|uniref:Tyrosine recombinase XerC n=1 Tax=Bythopirellula goksoeyrii TaxID=1400387 RepID=A0A5B9QDF3_9BACT|nr:tyrosine-type recombinase/integrase [Bythopirellula goksoeyrii]QEG35829.1 Tyrosine recombinase XerC [Bythopirellula goksoeyrii]